MKIFRNSPSVTLAVFWLAFFCFAVSGPAQKPLSDNSALARYSQIIDQGRLAEVERDLFNYVVLNPKDPAGFSLLARLRFKQNRINEAKSLLQKALALDPASIPARINSAFVNIKLGDVEPARDVVDGISTEKVLDNNDRLDLVKIFSLLGECKKASATASRLPLKIRNYEALPPLAACYLETGDKKNFESLLSVAKITARTNPAAVTRVAEVLFKAAKFREAADLIRPIIKRSSSNATALLLLARLEVYLKDFVNAKMHLEAAEKLAPGSNDLMFIKALLEIEKGNRVGGLDLLEKVLVGSPENEEILAQFALTAIRANQPVKAVRAAEKLLQLRPENLDFLYLYGAASLQSNNLKAAETALTQFTQSRPQDSRGCVALGLVFAAQAEKLQTAREQMQHCLEVNAADYEAAYQLGLSFRTQGDTQTARQYFEQAVKLAPDNPPILRDLGSTYLQSGEETKARRLLEKAVVLNPNDADTHFQLSRLYNMTGEKELAKKHLEIFQKLKSSGNSGM